MANARFRGGWPGRAQSGKNDERIGVYPGTFDPITLGHADIIRRGAKLVDQLIIGVTTNPSKNPMFTPDERMAMVEREVASLGIANVSVVGLQCAADEVRASGRAPA